MLGTIWEDAKRQFQYGNMVIQIILVNTAIFLSIVVLYALFFLIFQGDTGIIKGVVRWFMVPPSPTGLIWKPWSLFTYMFLHEGLMHFAMNMLLFYIYGRIFQDFLGNRKVLPLYIIGGLAGAAMYWLTGLLGFPSSGMLGASAAVWAVVMATTVLRPDYVIHLIFLGAVRLKYVTLVLMLLTIIAIPGLNTGGEMAHIGGMIIGWLFIYLLQNGNDLSVSFNRMWDPIASAFSGLFVGGAARGRRAPEHNPHMRVVKTKRYADDRKKEAQQSRQERVDEILDKINDSGYDSLTEEDKDFLAESDNDK